MVLFYLIDTEFFTVPTTTGTIDATFLIAVFDDFVENLPKESTTIVILDNAPTHTSKLFQAKIEEWEKRGLVLYFLPPYASTQTLEDYIHRVLASYGNLEGFEINFG
jgi:transposase